MAARSGSQGRYYSCACGWTISERKLEGIISQHFGAEAASAAIADYSKESLIAQEMGKPDVAAKRGIAELNRYAQKFGGVSVDLEYKAMEHAIPGFGKTANELSDAERAQRAEYFIKRCNTLQIGMPLPYDKRQRQAVA
jgi:hypothetical protein